MRKRWIILLQVLLLVVLLWLTGWLLVLEYHNAREDDQVYQELSIYGKDLETAAIVVKDGLVISGGKEGLFCIDVVTFEEVSLKDMPDMRYVRSLYVDDKERLWIGHEDGLTLWTNNQWTTYSEDDGLPNNRVHDITGDYKGRLYVGTYAGGFRIDEVTYKDGKWDIEVGRYFLTADGLTNNLVNVIYCDDKDRVWFGSYLSINGGLNYIYDDFTDSDASDTSDDILLEQAFYVTDGLPHSHVTSMLQDLNGVIWVGTGLMDRGGLCYFGAGQATLAISGTLTIDDGLAGIKVRSLFQDSRGIIWIGSEYDGIALFKYEDQVENGEILDILTTEKGLSNNEVKVAVEDKEGNIWLGTRSGITRVDKKLWE